LALSGYPVIIAAGAFRWYFLNKKLITKDISFLFALKNYWTGLSIGYFAPGSVGWDIFKVIIIVKKFGNALKSIFIVVTEKISGMIACVLLIIVFFPLIPDIETIPVFNDISKVSYIILFAFIGSLLVLIFIKRNRGLDKFFKKILINAVNTVKNKSPKVAAYINENDSVNMKGLFKKKNAKTYIFALLMALFIQTLSSVLTYLYFRSIDIDISLMLNILITPMLFFIFLLPISFGSIGVREASYIFLYGLFGVPKEQALIISLFTLTGQLLNILIGGIIMQSSNIKKILK
jgi:uncharacterized protein (TIRG00374 family)